MAIIYATLIVNGRKTFSQVPDVGTLRTQVAEILIEMGLPELVPVAYGGTLEG